ncbi:alanine--tRNA ligase [Ponticaulis sp.]|uniref:alanine--tRNA ligase n=1 Tax=Ponticaulis sp. TaxID=2020902 RepID=UPI000B6BE904|nr:alanine--tRNA ligase [Ponticaulis sp.]MAI90481.1 alanine--tRNA ligase [Ponticaulis sp.]OUY00177.1 MAG: alanine--tRNA ligase [Hyphomonadaceae bacterium TMED5]|tara:strand:+ start:102951 stop:105602 length:2652 start_codon:yes stop_codon:yes gene_type:complete
MTSVSDIRSGFLSYFEKQGHVVQPSAPLVPDNDPTLLFVNAGMVPFKNIFTGVQKPFAPRATTSQKCVRAGGKHNDLDNVGYTARHHTFFEMLGNFSFGDYFKEEAIKYAYDLITGDFGLPKEKLLVTVYAEDDEAFDLWKKIGGFSEDKIIRIATSDNFWSMGDSGPCGPCSEIFYDHGDHIWGGPPGSPEEDGDRFIEIWNLVFMQFNQHGDGTREDLPTPSIDTGMGLERISTILQGVHNNYDIDLFKSLIAAEEDVYKCKAAGDELASFRVIADHLRSSAFLLADGVLPSNEGRGYVLRRIMRRAMRHSHILGAQEPKMHELTGALIKEMGEAYPELIRAEALIRNQLEQEEGRFQRTLGRGLALLDEATGAMGEGDALPGETAFKLYDTYGFPLDLTQDVLRGRGLSVDTDGFEDAMATQRATGKANWKGSGDSVNSEVWTDLIDRLGQTRFTGYETTSGEGELLAILKGGELLDASGEDELELLFDATPFYAESGGQSGDHGSITFKSGAEFTVTDVQKRGGGLHVHIGKLTSGSVTVGDHATLSIDVERRNAIRANHSATHLLHAALRNVLGTHVTQKGSLVEADRLRFDFSHGQPVAREELKAVEDQVNAVIRQNTAVSTAEMAPEKAIENGALALFGEKYGEIVRVLTMGEALETPSHYSMEFCGGTHVARTGDIALFTVLTEGGVSAGIRRIEATTAKAAFEHMRGQIELGQAAADKLKSPLSELVTRVTALHDQRKELERDLSDAKRQLAMAGPATGPAQGPEEINGVKLMARVLDGVPAKELRTLMDEAKSSLGSGVAVFVAVNDGKAAVATGVTKDLMDKISAVELVRVAAAAVGGKGGGGRPDMAQAGGPDGDKAEDALQAVRDALKAV